MIGSKSNFLEVRRSWDLEEKALGENRYQANFVDMHKNGRDFNFQTMQEYGLMTPLLFQGRNGLGLRVPSEGFSVNDVKSCIGANRIIKVMDVVSQRSTDMKMRDWCAYFANPLRERILCVMTLEFSGTKLEHYVESPTVIRQSDWLDRAWPIYLKQSPLNDDQSPNYPKVRKFVHMAAGGSFIDWSFGMGGSSVWYHVLRGVMICWIIAPTEENLMRYEKWLQSPQQRSEAFFGDVVTRGSHQCQRVEVASSYTIFIPAGWLYSMYMPEDSLMFGGHFLHSFSGSMQISAWHMEEKIHKITWTPRYPHYLEMNWYVLARYVACLLGRDHVTPLPGGINPMDKLHRYQAVDLFSNYDITPQSFLHHRHKGDDLSAEAADAALDDHMSLIAAKGDGLIVDRNHDPRWQNITRMEWDTLVEVVTLLKNEHRKTFEASPPGDIGENAGKLLKDFRLMMRLHADDPHELSLTGTPLLRWPPGLEKNNRTSTGAVAVSGITPGQSTSSATSSSTAMSLKRGIANFAKAPASSLSGGVVVGAAGGVDTSGSAKRRRIRCRNCEPCRRDNCRDCLFCADMAKYGGTGTMKQCCIQKQCIAPVLPSSTYCEFCLDNSHATEEEKEADDYDMDRDIYECGICWQFVHPRCLRESMISKGTYRENVTGALLSDLPNYWECPQCVVDGKQGMAKSRIPKGLQVLRKMEQEEADGDVVAHKHMPNELPLAALPSSGMGATAAAASSTPVLEKTIRSRMPSLAPASSVARTRPPTTRNAATRRSSTVLLHTGESEMTPSSHHQQQQQVLSSAGPANKSSMNHNLSILSGSRPINYAQLQSRDSELRHCSVEVGELGESDQLIAAAYRQVLHKGLQVPFWRNTGGETVGLQYSTSKPGVFTLERRGTLSMARADIQMASVKKYSPEYISELMTAVSNCTGGVIPLPRGRPGRPPAVKVDDDGEKLSAASKNKQAKLEKSTTSRTSTVKDFDFEDFEEESMTIRSRRRGIQKPRRFNI